MSMRVLAVLPIVHAVLAGPVLGAPPDGVRPDPEIAGWYHSLRDKRGMSCCDEADCRPVPYRAVAGAMEVFIGRGTFGPSAPEAWMRVPLEAMLLRENPTGTAIACYYGGRIACFVRPIEG